MWRFPFFLLFSEWGVFCHRVCKKKIANCITFLVFKCLFLNYVWLMPICVSVPTLLTQNQSSVLSPKRDFAAVAVGNTGRAAVYETSDVFLCLLFLFSFNRLNINLLKELRQKQWFQTLIKKNDAFIHQTLTKRSHAVIVRLENHCGPFVFRVTCLDIVPSLKWWWLQAAYCCAFVLGFLLIDFRFGTTASYQLHYTTWLCVFSVWKESVWLLKKTDTFRLLHLKSCESDSHANCCLKWTKKFFFIQK